MKEGTTVEPESFCFAGLGARAEWLQAIKSDVKIVLFMPPPPPMSSVRAPAWLSSTDAPGIPIPMKSSAECKARPRRGETEQANAGHPAHLPLASAREEA